MSACRLLTLAAPLFEMTRELISPETTSGYEVVHGQVVAAMSRFSQTALTEGATAPILSLCHYALIAWIDETLMTHSWTGQAAWIQAPLQVEFFSEHLAGEGFFKRLTQCMVTIEVHREVLPLYAMCLFLGFKGIYRTRSENEFQELLARVQQLVMLTPSPIPSTQARDLDKTTHWFDTLRSFSPKKCLVISLVSALSLYLITCCVMEYSVRQQLNHLPTTLEAAK